MDFTTAHDALPATALTLENTADVLARADEIARHDAVVLQFPKWTDGRAYSQAVLLRGRLRFGGRVIASGDVVADMAPLLRRCGFDEARLRAGQQPEVARRALGLVEAHYQRTLVERQAHAAGPGAGAEVSPAASVAPQGPVGSASGTPAPLHAA